jgi:deoxyribonuclease V
MQTCKVDADVAGLVFKATSQIPKGMVSTYGDIAAALGDKIAARAVGEILSKNPTPIVVPCHRVVYSSGETGWYDGYGHGAERKVELLRSEGVRVENGTVADFQRLRFRDFRIPAVLEELREEQDSVRTKVVEEDDFGRADLVAGLDVSYSGNRAFAAVSVHDRRTGKLVEERTAESEVKFPYIPTFLSYREIPALRPLIEGGKDIIYLVDGQGTLHPRGAGIASHIGVCLDVPTVGAAKSLLVGEVSEPDRERSPIMLDGAVRGYRLGRGKKATYVSVGHRVSLDTAVDICEKLLDRGIPAPLRSAHEKANQARREAER